MNKIAPDRNIKAEIFNDFSLFSLNNVTIGQYSAKIIEGSNNVIVGNNAGKIAIQVSDSIFLGSEASSTLSSGNSNITIGTINSYLSNNNNSINLGFNNTNNTNSITIGNNLYNSNNINIGYSNSELKINNSNININQIDIGDIINLGFNNLPSNECIIIGNYNSNININIGSSNFSINNNSIIIGNNIHNNEFSLNINDLICYYEDNNNKYIKLGVGIYRNIPIIIGSIFDNNIDNNKEQFLIKGSLNINKIIIKNNNNLAITLKSNDNSPNIIYYLPDIPLNIKNLYLSVNNNGKLEWKEISNDMITTIITSGDIICNNINATTIEGFGYFINNININNNNTNDLKEGIRNIYFNSSLITNTFLSIINYITTDNIKGSITSNLYFNEELYKLNFIKNIEKINSDKIQEGSLKFYKLNDYYNKSFNNLINITTDNLNIGFSNIYYTEDNFNKYSNQIINNLKEGNNLYYNNTRFLNVFNTFINNNNTDIFIEGNSNIFYNNFIVNSNINNILNNINTDTINEGKSNLYFTNNRLLNFFNSNIPTSDKIIQGSNNFYFQNISNLDINSDFINQGILNRYYTNVEPIIINNYNTDIYKQGNFNIYLNESNILNQYNTYLKNDINTDNINEKNNIKFITNNFYNDDLIINGFIKSSNINNIDIDKLNIQLDEPSIGELTEVINIYDYNSLYLNSKLSNIELSFNFDSNISNSNVPFIVIENRVGINNINPIFNLQVGTGNDIAFFSKLHLADTDITTGNYGIMIIGSNNNINGHDLKIQTRNEPNSIFNDSFIVSSSGNIGIGNNYPQSLLHLNISSNTSDIIIRMTDNTTGHSSNNGFILKKDIFQNGLIWNYENANLIFGTNNLERFKIENNGNCFINVPSSYNQTLYGYNQKLTLGGTGIGNNWGQFYIYDTNINDFNYLGIIFRADNINNYCSIQTEKQGSISSVPLLLNPRGNNVGIGIYNPSQKLHVSGNIVATGNIISSFSDMRLKTKISDLNNSLEIISKINGFKYILNDTAKTYGFDDNQIMIGLNAQEVKEIIPEVISLAPFDMDKNDNDEIISSSGNNYLSIQYERLIPYLIEAIKELKKENEIIKKQLNI